MITLTRAVTIAGLAGAVVCNIAAWFRVHLSKGELDALLFIGFGHVAVSYWLTRLADLWVKSARGMTIRNKPPKRAESAMGVVWGYCILNLVYAQATRPPHERPPEYGLHVMSAFLIAFQTFLLVMTFGEKETADPEWRVLHRPENRDSR